MFLPHLLPTGGSMDLAHTDPDWSRLVTPCRKSQRFIGLVSFARHTAGVQCNWIISPVHFKHWYMHTLREIDQYWFPALVCPNKILLIHQSFGLTPYPNQLTPSIIDRLYSSLKSVPAVLCWVITDFINRTLQNTTEHSILQRDFGSTSPIHRCI